MSTNRRAITLMFVRQSVRLSTCMRTFRSGHFGPGRFGLQKCETRTFRPTVRECGTGMQAT